MSADRVREWCEANPERRAEHHRTHYEKKGRDRWLRTNYGITVEDYDRMLDEQGAVCYLCRQPEINRRLSVDHNHTTGEVRRLLCTRCNFLVGILEADPNLVERAKEYIR